MRTRQSTFAVLALVGVITAGCIDGIGPRPRPGAIDETDPGSNGRATLQWYEMVPRVITHNDTDSVTLNVSVSGTPNFVTVQMRTGQPVELTRSGGVYTGRLPANNLLFGYRVGDLHQLAGVIKITSDSVREHAFIANVKDATVPNATVLTVQPGVQMTEHVVNIRHDAIATGSPVPVSVIRTFYNSFPDDFHFLAVVEAVRSERPTFYTTVRNNTGGIGQAAFNNGAAYGSVATLEGIIQFPDDAEIDLARTDNIHEIAHRWMNYLEQPLVSQARTHWPLSSLAYGIMGWKHPVTGDPAVFPFDMTPRVDGTWALTNRETPRHFNDLELYLMGLLPPDSVQPHVVFANQHQLGEVRAGGILRGRVDTLRIADVIATNGPRTPTTISSKRDFRLGTIVLSRGGVLTRHELDFFEHVAARGEAPNALQFSNGVTRAFTQPFVLATGGRARLQTRLRNLQ